jgi:Sporulation protein YhaL
LVFFFRHTSYSTLIDLIQNRTTIVWWEDGNMTVPIWVFAVAAGIMISAFMAIKSGREDRQQEMEIIEREGEIYMERLEKEKEKRQGSLGT